ncbi:DUF3718 domain-containing protein [Alteromonas flava]|uniref:DUF3718 domain-containing protein n=1 Tax=Alteromonas flava TaxID=2048003 RepID=UPI000C29593B|nr:DUF3718 domain-containing protein [Alteromonas flava]
MMRTTVRKLMNFSTAATAVVFMSLPVSATVMDSGLEKDLVNICVALKSDSKLALHRAVKRSRLTYQQVNEGLVCNGESAQDFALSHNAEATAALLARKSRVNTEMLTAKRFE